MLPVLTLLSLLEIVAPGVRLSDPSRVIDFSYGAVQETFERAEPDPDGFRVFTIAGQHEIATLAGPDGTPYLNTRTVMGEVTGIRNLSVCGATACFKINITGLNATGIITDLNGNPTTQRFTLPGIFGDPRRTIDSPTADPDGFAYVETDGVHYSHGHAVRIDLQGQVVFDVVLPNTFARLLWLKDHYTTIATSVIGGDLIAADLTTAGRVGPSRTLVANAPPGFAILREGSDIRLALLTDQQVSILRLDDAITMATLESIWPVPQSFRIVNVTASGPKILAVFERDQALYVSTVGSTSAPKLLSYGPRPQIPLAIATASNDLIVWTEHDPVDQINRIFGAHIGSDGVATDRVPIEIADTAQVYNTHAAGIDGDVLVCWTTAPPTMNACAIVRPNRTVDRLSFPDQLNPLASPIAPTSNGWIVIRLAPPFVLENQISRSGVVSPTTTLETGFNTALVGVASDGVQTVVVTSDQSIVIDPGLTVVRRVPHSVPGALSVAFSADSYLLAGFGSVWRMDRAGSITSVGSFSRGGIDTSIAAARNSWIVCSGGVCTRVFPADPPELGSAFAIGDLATTASGEDRVRLLTASPTPGVVSIGNAIYFRELDFFDQPRRRAVAH